MAATVTTLLEQPAVTKKPYRIRLVWRNIILMGALHMLSLYGVYLMIFKAKWQTSLLAYFLYLLGGLGITGGAHRLWSHRSYKAKFPLRVFLMIAQTMAFQNHIYEWSRDHRVHHKYSETDADPHNALRGFFFSHVGWLLCRKHPEVIEKGKKIDCSDILQDPVVRFQMKNYLPLVAIICFVIPTLIPWFYWGEDLWTAYVICGLTKYCFTLNMTWLVNSAAHMWGNHPYDKHINPSENRFVSIGAVGEGFHNYHHVFPQDYKAAELGWKLNITTMFIDFCALLGLAYDRRTIPKDTIAARMERTGDGSKIPDRKGYQIGSKHD